METRVNSAARVQPTEGRYLVEPGTCAICAKVPSHIDEIFANPSIELEFYGCLYFCQACCFELGSFVMMVPQMQYQAVLNKSVDQQKNIDTQANQIAYLKGLLNARIDLAGRGEPVSDGSASVSLLETESEPDDLDSFVDSLEPDSD